MGESAQVVRVRMIKERENGRRKTEDGERSGQNVGVEKEVDLIKMRYFSDLR